MTRSIALATALLTAACFAPGASADHKPGHQGGGGGNAGQLKLTAKPNPVLSGGTLTLTGKLTGANNSGQQVTLRSDPFPFDVFGDVGTATTDSKGDFSFVQKPTLNTRYVARSGPDEGAPVTVAVQPRVGLRLSDYSPRKRQRVRFFGRVCPQHNGSTLAIQRRFSTGYRTVRRATLRAIAGSGCSSWTRTFRVRRDSRYRAVIGAHADHIRGVSRTRLANVS
ncbi:MAG TPA: hypothetical protein VFD31_08125 [Thermoleophilaceae bacterium]|nr:hypothetical protein [Thermoleophilaceae bacterium]